MSLTSSFELINSCINELQKSSEYEQTCNYSNNKEQEVDLAVANHNTELIENCPIFVLKYVTSVTNKFMQSII
jgi:hypothetical protein